MTDVTLILSEIERGDPATAEQLLPQACDELRKLASNQLAHEKPGKGYDAKARKWFPKLVKEYIRTLPDADKAKDRPPAPGDTTKQQ